MYTQTHHISSKRMVVTEKRKEKIGKGKRFKKKERKTSFLLLPSLPSRWYSWVTSVLPAPCLSDPQPCPLFPSALLERRRREQRNPGRTLASRPLLSQVGGCLWSPGGLSLCPDTPLGPPLTLAQLPAVKMTHRSKDTSSGILNHG